MINVIISVLPKEKLRQLNAAKVLESPLFRQAMLTLETREFKLAMSRLFIAMEREKPFLMLKSWGVDFLAFNRLFDAILGINTD